MAANALFTTTMMGLWYWFRIVGAAIKSRSRGIDYGKRFSSAGYAVAAGIMQLIPLKKKFMLEEQSSSLE